MNGKKVVKTTRSIKNNGTTKTKSNEMTKIHLTHSQSVNKVNKVNKKKVENPIPGSNRKNNRSKRGGGDKCDMDTTNKTVVYHLLQPGERELQFTNTETITYFPIPNAAVNSSNSDRNDIGGKIVGLLRECNDKNVLLFCSSRTGTPVAKAISNALMEWFKTNPTDKWKNVSIIHETSSTRDVIYMPLEAVDNKYNKVNKLRKLVNIFPNKYKSHLLSFKTIDETNKTFNLDDTFVLQNNVNVDNNTDYAGESPMANVRGNGDTFYFQRRDDTEPMPSSQLLDQWWYKDYFKTVCAFGRLRQFSGTCWFNAALHTLVLSQSITKMLRRNWEYVHEEVKIQITNIPLDSCPNLNKPLTDILWFIVYKIVIEGTKAVPYDGDIVSNVAARVKSQSQYLTEEPYLDAKKFFGRVYVNENNEFNSKGELFGDIYHSFEAIKIIFEQLGFNEDDVVYIDYDSVYDRYEEIKIDPKDSEAYNKRLGDFRYVLNEWNAFQKQMVSLEEPLSLEFLANVYVDLNKPNVIIMNVTNKDAPLKITVKNVIYKLESAVLSLKTGKDIHVVAALTCNNTRYIYDSNGDLEEADWPNGNIDTYLDVVGKKDKYEYQYMDYVIYVRDEVNVGGMIRNKSQKRKGKLLHLSA